MIDVKRIAVVLLLLCNACAETPTRIEGTGERVSPPAGWVDYCYRHVDDVDCVQWFGKPAP